MSKEKKIISGIVLLGVAFIFLGSSYSFLKFQVKGSKTSDVIAGMLALDFDESKNGDIIRLENARPMQESAATATDPYKFTIENTGTIPAYYQLYLDDVDLPDGVERIVDESLSFRLDNSKETAKSSADKLSVVDRRLLSEGYLVPGEKISFQFWIWIYFAAGNDVMDQEFAAKFRVEGTAEMKQNQTLAHLLSQQPEFKVTTVEATCPEGFRTSGSACYLNPGNTCPYGMHPGKRVNDNYICEFVSGLQDDEKEYTCPAGMYEQNGNCYLKKGEVCPSGTYIRNNICEIRNGTVTTKIEGNLRDDGSTTFITGDEPNSYVWYSGKLWNAYAIDNATKDVKLVSYDPLTIIYTDDGNATSFQDTYLYQWLNDQSTEGFFGTLRNPEYYLNLKATWNVDAYDKDVGVLPPSGNNKIEMPAGIMNYYEFHQLEDGFKGTSFNLSNFFTKRFLNFSTMTPTVTTDGTYRLFSTSGYSSYPNGTTSPIYPVIVLKNQIKVVSGIGTKTEPYRLEGDIDQPKDALLNSRYSGEYVWFHGKRWRILHQEDSKTKITSYDDISESYFQFDSTGVGNLYDPSKPTNIAYKLNEFWYPSLSDEEQAMVVDGTWYLGSFDSHNYRLTKCGDDACTTMAPSVVSTIGLPRVGEMFSAPFTDIDIGRFSLTPQNGDKYVTYFFRGILGSGLTNAYNVSPTLYLNANVQIKSGSGTYTDPFTLQ